MLPPDRTTSAGPSPPPALPASSAAIPTAPAPSTTSFDRSSRRTIASVISSSATWTMSSSSESSIPIVSSPGYLTKMPSAIVKPDLPACTPTIRTSGFTARSAVAMPAARPPPPMGISTVAASPHLLGELEPDRPLARDHARVLERMDEGRIRLLDVRPCSRHRVLEAFALEHELGAVVLARLDLRHRRVERDVDARADARLARGPRHGLPVVACACRDDAGRALVRIEERDAVDRAADLERARALEVLRLQPDLAAGEP